MKALFLDIDGVCNSEETLVKQYLKNRVGKTLGIDPTMAFMVGKIVLDTGCVLVISSSWRNWPDGMKQIKESVYPEIYGKTPNARSGFRGAEVRAYLKAHPEITKYAILDDDNDFYKYQPLFKTEWKTGITKQIAKKVTEYLNE